MSDQLYTQREWDRVVGFGVVPPEKSLEVQRAPQAGVSAPTSASAASAVKTGKGAPPPAKSSAAIIPFVPRQG